MTTTWIAGRSSKRRPGGVTRPGPPNDIGLAEQRRMPDPRHRRRGLIVPQPSPVVDGDRERDLARVERAGPDASDEEPRSEPATRGRMARIDVREALLAVMGWRAGNRVTDAGARHTDERQRDEGETEQPQDQLVVFPTGSSTMKAAPPSGRFSPHRRPE